MVGVGVRILGFGTRVGFSTPGTVRICIIGGGMLQYHGYCFGLISKVGYHF